MANRIPALDLFCGLGGWTAGFEVRSPLADGLARDGFRELARKARDGGLVDLAAALDSLDVLGTVSREPGDPTVGEVRERRDAALGLRGGS